MEKKKLKQKNNKPRKSGFFSQCFVCVSKNVEPEEANFYSPTSVSLQPVSNVAAKHEVSVTYQTTAQLYVMKPEVALQNTTPNNALLSQAFTEKVANSLSEAQENLAPEPTSKKTMDKDQKDQVVKAILGKYLAIKREERLNKKAESQDEDEASCKSLQQQRSDFLSVECFSSDSSEILVLDGEPKHVTPRPNTDFPTKSRSAPTTSTAHDSLADICSKMSRYRQQENKSDSYVTCCSDENTACKKKLELIFHQSSEEILSCLEDNSATSLQYNINLEKTPVITGSLRPDSALQQGGDEQSYLMNKQSGSTKFASQELRIRPSAKGEIGEMNGSAASLKWKLIISQHGRGGSYQ